MVTRGKERRARQFSWPEGNRSSLCDCGEQDGASKRFVYAAITIHVRHVTYRLERYSLAVAEITDETATIAEVRNRTKRRSS